ncbi:hypothetical protein [Enemella evansiae]|uniref:hypothetical protein n=1 Tax=Enemella evansiae TaxID=2016499 RepID=UPI000B95E7D8|nr:hypothetical protein [Enemella evansiae]OYO01224.1 hypothetical protein CGZ97_17470 [Enemella evansiae]
MSDATDFYGITLPPEPAVATGQPMQPITGAATAAILPYVRQADRATVERCAARSPAEYLHALLQHNLGRLPAEVADLVTAAINIEGPANRAAVRERQAEGRRRITGLRRTRPRTTGRGMQYRVAAPDPEFQHQHAAMLQRMGASRADAAREAAAYQRYLTDSQR